MLAVVVVVALDREVAGLEGERNRVGALGAVVREVGAGGIDRNSQLLHTHSAAVLVDFEDRARIDVITSMSHVSPTARWPLSLLWKTPPLEVDHLAEVRVGNPRPGTLPCSPP